LEKNGLLIGLLPAPIKFKVLQFLFELLNLLFK
jgi:hypothetical protein